MKTAVMFSGQGAQAPGMMEEIFSSCPASGEVFDRAKKILGRDLHALIREGTQEMLDETVNTQPCILVSELAGWRAFCELGIPCDAVTGFSLGEWAALAVSGAAAEEDVIGFIEKRADAMQRAVPIGEGSMAAMLAKDNDFVREYCEAIGDIAPASYNCAGNVSVAGKAAAVDRFCAKAEEDGIMVDRIAISIPAHSSMMQPAVNELRPLIGSIPMQAPKCPFAMNATGTFETEVPVIRENLIRQLSNPVMFHQIIEKLLEEGFDTFVEIGPGKVLSGLVRRTAKAAGKKVRVFQFNCEEHKEKLKQAKSDDKQAICV